MATADASFIAGTPPTPQNPLQTASNAASLVGQMNQNKLFPTQLQTAQTALGTARQEQAQAGVMALRHIIASIPPGPNQALQVAASIKQAVDSGIVQPNVAAAFVGNSPDMHALAVASATTGDELEKQIGTTQTINTGPATVTQQVNPFNPAAGPTPLATNTMGLSPEAASSPTPILAPNKDGTSTPSTVTRSQYIELAGKGPVPSAPALSAKGLSPEVASAPMEVYDTETQSRRNITREQFAEAPPGRYQATPSLGEPEAAAASAKQASDLVQLANGAPSRRAILDNMRDQATQFASGPQAPFWRGIGAVAAEYGIKLPAAPSTDATAAQEEFKNLAVQVIAAQRAQMGFSSTDSQVNMIEGSKPGETITPKGIQRMVGLMAGNEDYIAAEGHAWQKWLRAGHGPATYGDFQDQFNSTIDPRVFQAQHMTDEELKILRSNMTQAQRQSFDASEKKAKAWGLLK